MSLNMRMLLCVIGASEPAVNESDAAPILLAHRGLVRHAPENTLPGFATAIELGLSLELDVYQTSDKHLVVIHDETVDRTTNGTGKVINMTLAEIRKLDAGSWFDPRFAGEKIPTLEE
ncbi:MAG: glycerophosphodiester phosphodiesterase family protein, partial [Candidatus Poribacteria bacterium]|nr:glycerophosphodiester phosphodiesterase family protein [Candidatus Poribacteria bacterium]